MEKRIRAITRHLSGGTLLDIGCATGNFINTLQRRTGWQAQGVEVSPYAARIAQQRGLLVHTGTLESARYPDDSFEAVTLWDVLEHLHRPLESIAEIKRILKPGGILVFRVPNLDSIDAKIFGTYWVGYDAPRHLHFFRKRTIEAYLKEIGLDILSMRCNIGNYPTTVLSIRFWLRNRVSRQAEDRIVSLLNHPITRIAAAPFSYLSGLGLRGALITVTAQKP
jgi:2-polyprenyl-3-methyl-5-hydroxy-6-metoxy-1,4-benzoquinol methylase